MRGTSAPVPTPLPHASSTRPAGSTSRSSRPWSAGSSTTCPGAGKPLGDLGSPYDRDWWLKKLIEREKITVLPAALQLRKDDAELDALLDRETVEKVVRETVEDFNRRVIEARRQLQGGPPVVTPTRDVEAEVVAWRERRRSPSSQEAEPSRRRSRSPSRHRASAGSVAGGPEAPRAQADSPRRKVSSSQPRTLPTTPAVSCSNRPNASEVLRNDSE